MKKKRFEKEELDPLDHKKVEDDAKKGRAAVAVFGIGGIVAGFLSKVDWEKAGETLSDVASAVSKLKK